MSYSVPLPFICTILHATALSDGSTSSTAVIRSIQSGASTTSVLTSATASVPAASIPRLAANAKPVLRTELDDPDRQVRAPRELERVVDRAVVDDHDLGRGTSLGGQRPQALL